MSYKIKSDKELFGEAAWAFICLLIVTFVGVDYERAYHEADMQMMNISIYNRIALFSLTAVWSGFLIVVIVNTLFVWSANYYDSKSKRRF